MLLTVTSAFLFSLDHHNYKYDPSYRTVQKCSFSVLSNVFYFDTIYLILYVIIPDIRILSSTRLVTSLWHGCDFIYLKTRFVPVFTPFHKSHIEVLTDAQPERTFVHGSCSKPITTFMPGTPSPDRYMCSLFCIF
jgi:hypothetical protein